MRLGYFLAMFIFTGRADYHIISSFQCGFGVNVITNAIALRMPPVVLLVTC